MARESHCIVQIQETVWISGGIGRGGIMFRDIWQLDLETLQWSRLSRELPVPVFFHAMTVNEEGKMVVFGELVEDEKEGEVSSTPTNALYTSWMKLPSLKTMALEAACHYWPDLSFVKDVPWDCVKMLGINNNNNVSK